MKKIFTLLMLSIFTVMNVNAEEETLWTGDWYVTWNGTDGHNEWGKYSEDASLNQDVAWAFEVGAKINVYLEANEMKDASGGVYHKVQFDDWDWQALPSLLPVEFEGNKTITIDVTQDLATAVAAKGFRIHGHGFNVVKVTSGEIEGGGDDPVGDEEELWSGDWWFSWEAGNTDEDHKGWNANANGIDMTAFDEGQVIYFYLAKDSEHLFGNPYYMYRFDNSNWEALPGCAATDATSSEETKAKFVLTADIKTALASVDFVLHGHGLKLVKVTKVVASTGINTVAAVKNDGKYYNLRGQVVANPTKGLYIINGKKVVIK